MTNYTDYPIWRIRLGKVLDYLIVLFTILNTNSVYNLASRREFHILPILAALLMVHIVVYPTVFQKRETLKRTLILAGVWCAYIGIYALAAGGDIYKLFTKFVVLMLLLIVYFYGHLLRGTARDVLRCYINVMFVIALIAVFLWLTCSVLKWFVSTTPFYIDWGKERKIWNFHYLYFHWQNDFFIHGFRFYRNIGIFAEAPMFSLHLCSALMFDLLINPSKSSFRWFRIAWFCGTILTTFSITGYLFMMVVIGVDLYATLIARSMSKDPAVRDKAKKELIAVSALAVVGLFVGYGLVADKLASRSGGSRMEDYKNGYNGWKDNVWFGAGYGDLEARQRYASWRRQHRSESGFTNSPMSILCEGGIWFFLGYYVNLVYGILASAYRKDWRAMFCMILIVFLFITTTMEHTAYLIAVLAFCMADFLNKGYKSDAPLLGRPLTVPRPETGEEDAA